MTRFAGALVALAEGRTEPDEWLLWWAENADAVAAVCPRGWLLRLTPRGGGEPDSPLWTERALATSQDGACYVLDKLGVAVDRSSRYTEAYDAEYARWERARRAEARRRAAEHKPIIDGLAEDFPKLARFLRRNPGEIESMLPGASEADLAEETRLVGAPLPAAYRGFLSRTRELVLGDTVRLTRDHPFVHTSRTVALPTEGMLCFGEYWLEGDGDQVLFDLRDGTPDDPPVLYYAHDRRAVEQLAGTFTAWLESLPRHLG